MSNEKDLGKKKKEVDIDESPIIIPSALQGAEDHSDKFGYSEDDVLRVTLPKKKGN